MAAGKFLSHKHSLWERINLKILGRVERTVGPPRGHPIVRASSHAAHPRLPILHTHPVLHIPPPHQVHDSESVPWYVAAVCRAGRQGLPVLTPQRRGPQVTVAHRRHAMGNLNHPPGPGRQLAGWPLAGLPHGLATPAVPPAPLRAQRQHPAPSPARCPPEPGTCGGW